MTQQHVILVSIDIFFIFYFYSKNVFFSLSEEEKKKQVEKQTNQTNKTPEETEL